MDVALLVLAGLLAFAHGSDRLLAVVPAGTLAATAFYVAAGGILMLATWSAAAAFALGSRVGQDSQV